MNKLEAPLKIFGVIVTAAGLLFAIFQFNKTYTMDVKRPFLEKQMELCLDASTTVAKIAVKAEHDPKRKELIEHFWTLYYGPMNIVEGNWVESNMVCFGRKLRNETSDCNDISLNERALRLAKSCRDLIAHSWGTPLDSLVGSDQD